MTYTPVRSPRKATTPAYARYNDTPFLFISSYCQQSATSLRSAGQPVMPPRSQPFSPALLLRRRYEAVSADVHDDAFEARKRAFLFAISFKEFRHDRASSRYRVTPIIFSPARASFLAAAAALRFLFINHHSPLRRRHSGRARRRQSSAGAFSAPTYSDASGL